jgi:hypothetical protein
VVEGAPLLRAYGGKTSIEGSNPSLSAKNKNGALSPVFLLWVMLRRFSLLRRQADAHQIRSHDDVSGKSAFLG